MNAVFLLNPRFNGPEWRRMRLGSFIGTGLSAFAPIAHAWVLWGPMYLWNVGVPYYLLEGLLLLIGCWFWEVRLTTHPTQHLILTVLTVEKIPRILIPRQIRHLGPLTHHMAHLRYTRHPRAYRRSTQCHGLYLFPRMSYSCLTLTS